MDEDHSRSGLWDKAFDVDSQSGTGRIIALILVFAVLGGTISWLIG